eukprot:TRINITY_DN3625_c1_g3_i1.p1 TRINITY_DN3625_c1_g3~~TRINITY_DN3625_c1_g3_i1.p1  ORF type:complete len:921 (+),score=214.48 TRINITY_DN3625_c1_g3_i1:57-2765(+)
MQPFKSDDHYLQCALGVLQDRIQGDWEERAKAREECLMEREEMEPRPVLTLVSRKLDLTREEVRAMHWVVLHNTGCQLEENNKLYDSRCDSLNICKASGMTPGQLLTFLSPERRHMKEGLIEVEDGFDGTIRSQTFKMPREVLAGFLGVRIAPSEYLKISDTSLSEVLEETGRYQPLLADDNEEGVLDLALEEEDASPEEPERTPERDEPDTLCAYKDDLDYLSDRFEVVAARLKLYNLGMKDDDDRRFEKQRPESQMRELQSVERAALRKCEVRLSLTSKTSLPRLETVRKQKNFNDFELWTVVTLLSGIVSQDVRRIGSSIRAQGTVGFDVGTLLGVHCIGSLRSQMENRKSFHKQSPLVTSGIVSVSDRRMIGGNDLMDCVVEIDRRMLDYFVGLDTKFSDIIDAANLYTPKVDLSSVILPEAMKKSITDTVENHEAALQFRQDIGFHDATGGYGTGVILLFHGPPGTGKTMMANALAKQLEKRLLLVTVPMFGDCPPETMRQVFREASIQNALVFFDECDAMLETRDNSKAVTLLLTELERFDGLLILATNRAATLDEALLRRITLSVDFPHPDATLREKIWRSHIPHKLDTKDINWSELSVNYELSGGFIKNAVVNAITKAVSRDRAHPVVSGADLDEACQQQVRGRLQAITKSRIAPTVGIAQLITEPETEKGIKEVIGYEKARGIMRSQWGFKDNTGTVVVFAGPKGTGKTLAAEVVAYELARPMQVMSVMEIMSAYRTVTKNVATLFSDARDNNVVLLLEGVEQLEGESYKSFAAYLLFHAERAGGLVILSTSGPRPSLRPKFEIPFALPTKQTRKRLWEAAAPPTAPLSPSIDFGTLAEQPLTGAEIKNAMYRAAAETALSSNTSISMQSIRKACEDETSDSKLSSSLQAMYC